MTHVLVIANETAASGKLLDAVRAEAGDADDRVTVVAPVNEPRQGYVVYEDTRRAAAGRRLEKTLKLLRDAGVAAQGFVVETGPVQAAKDALAQLEPPVDQIIVSTHGAEQSGWLQAQRRRGHHAARRSRSRPARGRGARRQSTRTSS